MIEKWLEALTKKKRIFYPYEKPTDGVNYLREIDSSSSGWVGSFSISSRKTKIYNIKQPAIVYQDTKLIGTEIARLLLMLNNPPRGFRKITAQQLEETPPPLYANPSTFNGVYVDIKSCYYTLIEKLWGIKYARNLWVARDTEIPQWHVPESFQEILREWKAIRNAIYGLLRAKVRLIWKYENGKIVFSVQKTKNEHFYPDICLAIMDITQAIATIAVALFDARYVAIDGFILPTKHAKNFQEFLAEYGFKSGIKEQGKAIIKNFYSYIIGEKETKTFSKYETAPKTQSNLLFNLTEAQEILQKFKPLLKP